MNLCPCPQSASLTAFLRSDLNCNENLGQTRGVIVQRTKTGSTLNEITIATADPADVDTWTALEAASDSTKVVVLPSIVEVNVTAGEARTYGSGNQVAGGISVVIGSNPTAVTAKILSIKQSIIKTIKQYGCDNIAIFLIQENGAIVGLKDADTATKFRGIPAASFFVSDKVLGQYDTPDHNMMSWQFYPNWSDMLHVIKPNFDPIGTWL
jgi:hypothetical protein